MAEESQETQGSQESQVGEESQLSGLNEADIERLFNFNPFDGSVESQDSQESQGTQESQESQETQKTQESQESHQQETQSPTEESREQRLERELQEMREKLSRVEGRTEARQESRQESQQPHGPDAIQTPSYEFEVPDELVNMLVSGDEGQIKKALATYAQGLAQNVHRQAVHDVNQRLSRTLPQYLQQVTQTQTQQDGIRQDFFQNFPELQRQELMPVIKTVAEQVQQETGINEWNETLRNAIGRRVREVLNIKPENQNGQSGAVQNSGAERPAPQTGGARTTPSGGGSREQRDMMDVVFGR